ncbi:flap endonuclease 1-like [Hemitrygon akajei]|uniref:flap endonuclease 1-like n=1 Tax=Hemitrygon akajei TaxID=2704970 RepID=UPI003BF9610E
MGCDYCEKIRGVGLKRALPLIQTHKSIEGIVQNLDTRRFPAPEDWPYQEARTLFLQPEVVDPHDVVLEWGEPDEEGLVQLLVHEKKAKEKRVRDRIRRLRESLRDVERRSRMFTAEKQQRLDEFYRKVRGLRYCRQMPIRWRENRQIYSWTRTPPANSWEMTDRVRSTTSWRASRKMWRMPGKKSRKSLRR